MKKNIIFILSLVFILFSISVFAVDNSLIDNSTLTTYKSFSGNNEFGFGSEKIGDTYYISYLKTDNTYRKEFVASSIDLVNWDITNINPDDINQEKCFLFKDQNDDLSCIYYKDTNSLYYWIKKSGQGWYSNKTEITESSMNFLDDAPAGFIDLKYDGNILHLFSTKAGDETQIMDYTLNLEKGSYIKTENNLGSSLVFTSGSNYYIGKSIYKENSNDYSFYSQKSSSNNLGYSTYTSNNWDSITTHFSSVSSFYYLYKTSGIYDYFIYISTTGHLMYAKLNKNTNVWGSTTDMNLVKNVYDSSSETMIEGKDNLWFVYIDVEDNNLRIVKIPKSSNLIIESDTIIDNSGVIDYIGSALGNKPLSSSTLQLYDNYLVVPYMKNGKIYITKYDTQDAYVQEVTGTNNCNIKPNIVSVNSSNSNPICWQQNDANFNKIVNFNINTQYECENYTYQYCDNCSIALDNLDYQGYVDYFNLGENNNASERGWQIFINLPIFFKNSLIGYVGSLNETSGEIYHCLKNVDYASCSPVYNNFNIMYMVGMYLSGSSYNAVDFRTKNSAGNYINIMMYNCSTDNTEKIYAYYSSAYHLIVSGVPCAPMRTIISNDLSTDTYTAYIDTNLDSNFEYIIDNIPFVTSTSDVKYMIIYQDTSQPDANFANFIDTIVVDLNTDYLTNLTFTNYHNTNNPASIGYVDRGIYNTKLCVLDSNLYYDNVDCYDYQAIVKECNTTELNEDGIYLPTNSNNDTSFSTGDVAYDFIAWLNNIGIRSVASKMFLAIIIMMIMSLIAFVISQGNMFISAGAGILTLVASVYLGLMPLWVIILLIILTGGIIALFFSGKG